MMHSLTKEIPNSVRSTVDLSIVIPVYQCAPCLRELHTRLTNVLSQLQPKQHLVPGSAGILPAPKRPVTGLLRSSVVPEYGRGEALPRPRRNEINQEHTVAYEIIFTDDGSTDGSSAILRQLANDDSHVIVSRFERNSGQFAAIANGLSLAKGSFAVIMDADLQQPPEDIPRFLEKAREGFDIVLGIRSGGYETGFRFLASRLLRLGLRPLNHLPNHLQYGAFILLSRRAIDSYLTESDKHRGILIVLDRLRLPHAFVHYKQSHRFAGRSSYSVVKLIKTAVLGCFVSRSLTCRLISAALLAVVLGGFVFLVCWFSNAKI